MKFLSKIPKKKLRGVVLLRLDFNTEDDWRMKAALPTIKFLLMHGSKIVIVSHKGRPKGIDRKLSLENGGEELEKLLKRKVYFFPNFNFAGIKQTINSAPKKSILLLENLRFLNGEESDSKDLARELASLADYYVNDAFAVSHRANASVRAITRFLPSYGGLLLEKEVANLSRAIKNPKKPLVVVLGGGKASDKLGLLKNFKNKASKILLGGAPANTLLMFKGVDIKKSVADRDAHDLKKIKPLLRYNNLVLPKDFIFNNNRILDIGKRTAEVFAREIEKARTIIWNGPLGLFEKKPYGVGTLAVARAIAKNRKAFSLAGGGETVMFLKKHSLDKKFSFISTGGGAMLEFLAGKKLPGIKALERK